MGLEDQANILLRVRIDAAQTIYQGREKYRKEYADIDESSFRLIRDFGVLKYQKVCCQPEH